MHSRERSRLGCADTGAVDEDALAAGVASWHHHNHHWTTRKLMASCTLWEMMLSLEVLIPNSLNLYRGGD